MFIKWKEFSFVKFQTIRFILSWLLFLLFFWVFLFCLFWCCEYSRLFVHARHTQLYAPALSCFVLFPCLLCKNGSPSAMQLDFAWTLRNLLVGFLLIFLDLVRKGSFSLFWMFFSTRVKISSVTRWDNFWNHVLTLLVFSCVLLQ